MLNLKQNNERLQRLVTSRSLAGSQTSLGTGGSGVEDPRRYSLADQATMHQVRNSKFIFKPENKMKFLL